MLYFIIAALVVYLIVGLLMADFSWVLHIGFLGWISAIIIILWFFLQIEKEYNGCNIEEEEIDSWNEEDESDDQYISKKEARKIAEDVCKEMFNMKEDCNK
ncbi:MAG: hypothetical protein E6507_09730 [Prevotella bivia]|nr:hypothetical protein [Prevotella bivia]